MFCNKFQEISGKTETNFRKFLEYSTGNFLKFWKSQPQHSVTADTIMTV